MYTLTEKIENILTSRKTFFIFSALFLIYIFFGLLLIYDPGASDYWIHLATIKHLANDLTNTANAYVSSSKPFFLNTPYHLFWGLVSKISNVHPFWLLPVIGVINSLLFLVGSDQISKFLTKSNKYSLITVLTLLFFWYKPMGWSGFYHFGLLPLSIVYPYWCALPLSLIIISKIGESKKISKLILLTISMALVFLIHPLTASFLFLSIFIKTITANISIKFKLIIIATPIFAFLLCLFWPYFPVGSLILNTGEHRFALGKYWVFYVQPWKIMLPALIGLLYIPISIKTRKVDFAVAGLIAATAIYIGNRYTLHNPYISRYLIYVCFFLQISIVMLLKNIKGYRQRKLSYLVFFIFLIVFGAGQIKLSLNNFGVQADIKNDKPVGTHSNNNYFRSYSKISDFSSKDDVVFAPLIESWKLPAIVGCYIVGSYNPDVFSTDEEYFNRKKDTTLFFDNSTSNEIRINILEEYKVQFVMVPSSFDYSVFDKIPQLVSVLDVSDYKLYEVQNKLEFEE